MMSFTSDFRSFGALTDGESELELDFVIILSFLLKIAFSNFVLLEGFL